MNPKLENHAETLSPAKVIKLRAGIAFGLRMQGLTHCDIAAVLNQPTMGDSIRLVSHGRRLINQAVKKVKR